MGIFSDYAKQRGFLPLELNEDNVNTIYKRCLPTEDTPVENIVFNYLDAGHKDELDDSAFFFDGTKLTKEYKNIAYLFGQLYDVHEEKNRDLPPGIRMFEDHDVDHPVFGFVYLKNMVKNYMGLPWFNIDSKAEDIEQTVYKLMALSITARSEDGQGLITRLFNKTQACHTLDVYPTLSPKDPDFDEWSKSEEGKKILAHFQD